MEKDPSLVKNKYDIYPYPSKPFIQTSPNTFAAIAQLFHLDPPKLNNARVLELGSSDGGNLIPMAIFWPQTEFIGIDYSKVQVEQANKTIQKLNLKNIQFLEKNILELDQSLGSFDYIICHGVFSWVPTQVQEAILRYISTHLKDNGLAFISYNVYPGWKICEISRDLMLHSTEKVSGVELKEKIEVAKKALHFVNDFQKESQSNISNLLSEEIEYLNNSNEHWLVHEYLEDINQPMYFKDFNRLLHQHQLSHLSDVSLNINYLPKLSLEKRQRLLEHCNYQQDDLEQYFDFLTCRRFRQSIVCKNQNLKNYNADLKIDLKNKNYLFFFSIQKDIEMTQSKNDGIAYYFCNQDKEQTLLCSSKIKQTFLDFMSLHENFTPLNTREMIQFVQKEHPHEDIENIYNAGNILIISLLVNKRLQLFSEAPAFDHAKTLSEKPKLHEKIRLLAIERGFLCHPIHNHSVLNKLDLVIIQYMDGEHTIEDITQKALKELTENGFHIMHHNEAVLSDTEKITLLHSAVENVANNLLSFNLLES